MTDPKKPSKNEDEYFAKRDAELLAASRAQAQSKRDEDERRSHYMKCPKCGSDLVTQNLHGVQTDNCPECGGLWLDAGELDQLLKHEEPGLLRKVFGDVVSGLRARKENA